MHAGQSLTKMSTISKCVQLNNMRGYLLKHKTAQNNQ